MKKLLVLAAGLLQIPVIKKAKEMGIFVIAADGDENAIGLKYADKSVVVNITSEDEVLKIAKDEQIDGVIHPCSEVSMNVMGRLNDELGLSGITKEAALRATNKHLMREAFEKAGAPSPKSFCYEDSEEAWTCFDTLFTDSAILKPSRNSGSRGITKIHKDISKEDFIDSFERARIESRDKSVMLEEFIEGPEFSVEIIVWNHRVNVLTITDKKTTEEPYFVELGHNQPSIFPPEIQNEVKTAAIAGVKALNVNNCACHAEIKVQKGKAYIMEIGARLGGDFISTELTPLSTGIDMVAAAINCALGVEPNLMPIEKKQGVCIRYFCPRPGKLISINNTESLNDKRVYQWKVYRKVGETIPVVTSSLCRSGHLIVTENTPEKAIEVAEEMIEKVKIITE